MSYNTKIDPSVLDQHYFNPNISDLFVGQLLYFQSGIVEDLYGLCEVLKIERDYVYHNTCRIRIKLVQHESRMVGFCFLKHLYIPRLSKKIKDLQ